MSEDHWTQSARKAAKARWEGAAANRAPDLPGEEWRPVPSYPGYEASSEGRVRSQFTVLALTPGEYGYPRVAPSINGRQKPVDAHIMVCEAFHGLRPTPEHECRHKDGVRPNIKPSNLVWGTARENQRDRKDHGTSNAGERNGKARLTAEQAKEIYRRAWNGEDQKTLAAEFETTQGHVSLIKRGQKWASVTGHNKPLISQHKSVSDCT